MENFKELLNAYVAIMETKHKERDDKQYPDLQKTFGQYTKFRVDMGKRFAKIIIISGGQASVHCFVEIENGDIHKAATFKAPQKNGVRGNLTNITRPIFGRDFYK